MKEQPDTSWCRPYRDTHLLSTSEGLLSLPSIRQERKVQQELPLAAVRMEYAVPVSGLRKSSPSQTIWLPESLTEDFPVRTTLPGVSALSTTGLSAVPFAEILMLAELYVPFFSTTASPALSLSPDILEGSEIS